MSARRDDFSTFFDYTRFVGNELQALSTPEDSEHPEYGMLPWDAPCRDCMELPSRRTDKSRYFVAAGSGGKRFYLQQAAAPLHFQNKEGQWMTRDQHLRPTGEPGRFYAPSQSLPTALDLNSGRSSLRLGNGFELEFQSGASLYGTSEETTPMSLSPPLDLRSASVGKDGFLLRDAWPDIDLFQRFGEGRIKTDYRLRDRAALPPGERMHIRETWFLPDTWRIEPDPESGEWHEVEGLRCWSGDLRILGPNRDSEAGWSEWARLQKPLLYDQARASNLNQPGLIGYRWTQFADSVVMEIVVSKPWLKAEERVYPITVDPLLYGTATYALGEIGFNYDPVCFDLGDYCSASMTVTVPGMTTLTNAWFDAQYFSVLMGCVASLSDCLMRQAAFQIVGPCDTSPAVASYWSCLPPEGDSSGTCYGDSLNMFNTIACIPPSCDDHVLSFEMRTFHCSCNGPNCGVICHFMPENTWKVTIEGRTVEEDPILSPNYPDFTICQGDTIALTPTAQWGVPPYTFQWAPDPLIADTIFVSPDLSTTYTSVVFDACNNTDTVFREVIVNPLPNPAPGPFGDCIPSVLLDAGPGFVSYFWPHSGESSQQVSVSEPGTYEVIVSDLNGCVGSSQPIVAELYEPPVVTAVPDTLIIDEGSLAQLLVTTTAGGSVNYTWSPAGTLTCTNCPSPLAFPQNETVYYVFGEQNGCVGEPDSMLVLINQISLVLPNAFTPNGDGINDVFRVTNPSLYPLFEMIVFNRWGQMVFQSDDIMIGWDGSFQGREQEVGTYIWLIRYRKGREDGEEVLLRGNVTLIR